MSRNGSKGLIVAVAKAAKKKLDVNDFEDRLLMQKGCFILNTMGVEPKYNFGLYIRGPYSSDLADDYYELHIDSSTPCETDVPSEHIDSLTEIMIKGTPFVEAYATILLARKYNPNMKPGELVDFVVDMKPHLKKKIEEASEYLNPTPSAI